jgi:hypothetical protein
MMPGVAAIRAFGPDTLEAMGTALEVAWSFVQRSGETWVRNPDAVRDLLARDVLQAAQFGAWTKLQMADYAVGRLRVRLGGIS